MEILGYIAYTILVVLAITWAFGVRVKLGITTSTIIGSMFFSLSAIIIPIIGLPFIYALLVIPLGYLFSLFSAYVMSKSKLLSSLFILLGSIYAGIIRVGIDKNKIRLEQEKAAHEAVEGWARSKEK
jgi:prepilin signal peptidase PulO-like enzyme (type II secretory pathway)